MAKYTLRYGHYELICDPQPMNDRTYAACLVVAEQRGDERVEQRVTVEAPPLPTEAEAAELAATLGKRWVDSRF